MVFPFTKYCVHTLYGRFMESGCKVYQLQFAVTTYPAETSLVTNKSRRGTSPVQLDLKAAIGNSTFSISRAGAVSTRKTS